jgi:hypothetical protein
MGMNFRYGDVNLIPLNDSKMLSTVQANYF